MTRGKVLVTGAGGFIGSALSLHLAAQGYRVTGVDRAYANGAPTSDFDAQVADFRDAATMRRLLSGVEVVYHLASAHLKFNLDETEYWDTNVEGTRSLLKLVHASSVSRYVHVSSVGVYGDVTEIPAHETTACAPRSVYGRTKLAGEREVQEFCVHTSLPAVIVRPTWVFGASCPRLRKLYRSLKNRTFVMVGRGRNLRHPLYINDLLQAFDLVRTAPIDPADLFILGGAQAITSWQLVRAVCKVFDLPEPIVRIPHWVGAWTAAGVEAGFTTINREPPLSRRTLEFFDCNNAFDISKSRGQLGFVPKYSFVEGLMDCRASLQGVS